MELFLLLSIGMSIVAFISIALNQAPVSSSPVKNHNLEPALPGEHFLLSPEKLSFLKLEDQVIQQDFESEGNQRESFIQPEVSTQPRMELLVAAES